MRIAIFSDCYLDLTGGIVTNINTEKKALEARGHTVYVFSSAFPRSANERQKLAKENIFPVKSCRVFGRGITPIARRPGVIEKQLAKEHPELKDFDIFYVHYEAGCSIAGLRLAKKYGIPSIQVMHGREDVGEENLIPKGFRTIVAFFLNWFHSWYIPHHVKVPRDDYCVTTIARAKMWTLMVNHANFADTVITPSEHFRKKLLHYGVTKPITAIHHGIADELLLADLPPKTYDPKKPLEIIWHSRVSGEKRVLPFLQAIKIIGEKQLPYHLSVYGDGPELKKAMKYAHRHHLNTDFYGTATHKTIQKALKKSHLDVLVSYDYDTFGMTLIEAAATGTPSLIVDPVLAEVLPKDSYILAKDPSPKTIADAIYNIYKHPSTIERMSAKLLAYRPHLKNSTKLTKLLKIFTRVE